eukprot:gene16784-12008_t
MGKGKGKGKAQQKKATNSKPIAASGVDTSKSVLLNGNSYVIIENDRVDAKGNDAKDEVDDAVEDDNGPETSDITPTETNLNGSDNGTDNSPIVDDEQNTTSSAEPPALPASTEPQPKTVDSSEQAEQIASLQAMVDRLSKEKEEATKREESHRESIASLRQQLDTATDALAQTSAHNKALQEQVAALKALSAESRAGTEALRAQVAHLTATAEALSADLQLARTSNTRAAQDDSIATRDVPAPSTAEDSVKEATTEAATEAFPEPPSASHAEEEGFANFEDDTDTAAVSPPPPPPAPATDEDTSDDWARRRISIGIIAQLLPETSPFAPQQFVKAEAQVASLVRMPLTQFAQSLLRGMEGKELCHPTKTKAHATFVDKTFVFSTVDVVATGSTTWTRGGKTPDDQVWSTTATASLLYRKMIRLKKSVYYNGDRVVHGVSSGRAPTPRPGVFKQISQSFSFSFNKSTSQVAAVAPATAAAMDTSGSSHHHHHQHGADHVDCVLQRLSRNLATATAVSVHGNDVVGGGARKKTTAVASFPLAPDMFTLDYYATADEDTTTAAAAATAARSAAANHRDGDGDAEAMATTATLPPTHATRVVARVVPVFAWPGDQKDAFHKTLTQTRMIFDVAEGKYISPEDILRRHNYSLVVHK